MLPGSPPKSTTCTLILASDVLLRFPNQHSKVWDLPPHRKPVAEEAPLPCLWFLSLVRWTVKLRGGRTGQNSQGRSFPSLLPSLAPGGLPGLEHMCENNCRWSACEEGFVSRILINGELWRWAPLGWAGSSNPLGCWPRKDPGWKSGAVWASPHFWPAVSTGIGRNSGRRELRCFCNRASGRG